MDERPVRIWVHPNLKSVLSDLNQTLDDSSIKHTSYHIPSGLPITSEIAAIIIKKILDNKKTLISVEKLKNVTNFNINISEELKNPIVFLISSNWSNLTDKDKEYLNLELQKIKGIKKNDIKYR